MKNYLSSLFIGAALLTTGIQSAFAQDQVINGQLVVNGNTFIGNPNAKKQFSVDGNVFMNNGVAVGGILNVTGKTSLGELVTIGKATFPTLQVNGQSNLAALFIGTPSAPQQLNVNGNTFLHNQVTIDGPVFVGTGASPQQVNVNGNVFLHNDLGVKEGLIESKLLTVDDLAAIGGPIPIAPALAAKYKLWVQKGVASEDYVIAPTSQWSDYVFHDNYNRPSLKAVEKFIKENRHLEGVPSESEVAEKGYSLRDVNVTLLRKVEELTLYSIEQDKKVTGQDKKITAQQQQLERLAVELAQLKATITKLKK